MSVADNISNHHFPFKDRGIHSRTTDDAKSEALSSGLDVNRSFESISDWRDTTLMLMQSYTNPLCIVAVLETDECTECVT